jgi:2,4-dienoyl-CoA reductase-like NADH-dependent reductase (Old Yellow Enzyme family)
MSVSICGASTKPWTRKISGKGDGVLNNSIQSALFTPFYSANLTLSNRIVMAPMTRGQSPRNIPTPEVAQYYRRRAEGGAGLIITECTFIDHPTANGFVDAPAFHGDEALGAWQAVVNAVHSAGGKIIPQIWHAGAARSVGTAPNETMLSIGPLEHYDNGQQVVKGMTEGDIEDVIEAFRKAATDAASIGFDGVEIHGAHSYLIDQFLWHKSNRRRDAYGGSLKNRVRFACQVVESIRGAVGGGYPILFRFSQWKLTDYEARIASSPKELEQILLPLVEAGVDIFHASTRRFWQPAFSDSEVSLAGWTKKISGRPVIAVGSVGIAEPFSLDIFSERVTSQPSSVELVERNIENGEFDLVAVGRALLGDPNWPQKIRSGELDKILPFSSDSLATLS